MKKVNKSSWPVLIISGDLGKKNDSGIWLDQIVDQLRNAQNCSVILSSSYNDALDIIRSREDLGTILIEKEIDALKHHLSKQNKLHLNSFVSDGENLNNKILNSDLLIKAIRAHNKNIPILLMTTRCSVEDISDDLLVKINGTIWKFRDTPEFLVGHIERHVIQYVKEVMPPFFSELVKYVNEYKYAWHTPGHMGGQGFLRSPSGTAFHKFFGEDVLRADLSISVPELGSLLDHSGVTGEAEKFSSRVFGSDQTYYVLNGTSTANQIIWRSEISPGEKTLVDRNCHKSLNYAMVITDAKPDYMTPLRNKMGIIGPVDFTKIPNGSMYKMSALTNSTYDGVCYKLNDYVINQLSCADNWHFDEAWYAYAKFHPLYYGHYAMGLESQSEKLIFASQSTHKLLTAFSQASMLHIKLPEGVDVNYRNNYNARFNESYMMHGSTSPQYNMVASLEVATKMMYDNGEDTFNDIILEAIELRRKVASIKSDVGCYSKDSWFFGLWQPSTIEKVSSENSSIQNELISQEAWEIKPNETWHGFEFNSSVKKSYSMLDPIKLTFTCPGFDLKNGLNDKDGNIIIENGIPAAVVTNYLIGKGIVCEKSDYYSFLILNSIGTTKGKQGTLLAELLKFKELYDNEVLLEDVFPELVKNNPLYSGQSLKEHCTIMHKRIAEMDLIEKMNSAFEVIPKQEKTPGEAYRDVVGNKVAYKTIESIRDELIDGTRKDASAGVMIVPYPPGIPMLMGGESFKYSYRDYKKSRTEWTVDSSVLEYLIARQDFEFEFPGYESDIHGIERVECIDKKTNRIKFLFQTLI